MLWFRLSFGLTGCIKFLQLLALGYIYGGNMFIFDRYKDMRYFQVRVKFRTYRFHIDNVT